MSGIHYVVPAVIGLLLLAATVLRRDLWPFSHYPMFAGYDGRRTIRYFRLQFTRPNAEAVVLAAVDPRLGDEFDREFNGLWPVTTDAPVPVEIALRFWGHAARHQPILRDATQAQVILRLAHLGPSGAVAVADKVLYVVDLGTCTT